MKDCKDPIETLCSDSNNGYVNRTVFVDAKFGNNETAIIENLNYPTRTIKKAFEFVKENRSSKNEQWNVIVRLGDYKISAPVPNNVIIIGAGQGTRLIGVLHIKGSARVIEVEFIGTALPSIEVNIREKNKNAVVLFAGVDFNLDSSLNSSKLTSSLRKVIEISSRAIDSSVTIKDCRLTFDLSKLDTGENKFIVVHSGRTNILTSIIRASGHTKSFNTIVESINAFLDIELGNTFFTASSNQLFTPMVFYANNSSNELFIRDNRASFIPRNLFPNSTPASPTSNIPNAVILNLSKNNGRILSRNAITNFQGLTRSQQLVAYVVSDLGFVSVLGLESLNGFQGNVDATHPVTRKNNIKFNLSADGNVSQSGVTNGRVVLLPNVDEGDPGSISFYNVEDDVSRIVAIRFASAAPGIIFPEPANVDPIKANWTVEVTNNTTFNNLRVSAPPNVYTLRLGETAVFYLVISSLFSAWAKENYA